jgi:hypothetical protein
MKRLCFALLALLLAGAASAQTRVFVRGTIAGLDGNVLAVKSRDGRDLKINLAENFGVRAAKAITLADIKPGDFVGPASRKQADGSLVAISLQLFPEALRGRVPEGHMNWDLEPGSMMTNATVAAMVQATGGRELTLEYKGGSQKILVPESVPIFTTVQGDRSLLVPGAYVFIACMQAADGTLSAAGVNVSKDGVKPAN